MINTTGWKEIDKLFEKAHQLYTETKKLNVEIEKAMRFRPKKVKAKIAPADVRLARYKK
jgi:hypothetical protein